MMELSENIIQMLKSDDIEMVRLGAILLTQCSPKKQWNKILRKNLCVRNGIFRIPKFSWKIKNHEIVIRKRHWLWKFISKLFK